MTFRVLGSIGAQRRGRISAWQKKQWKRGAVRHTFTCQFGIETLMSHYLYRFISSSGMRTRLWDSQTNFNSSKVQFELPRHLWCPSRHPVSSPVRYNLNTNHPVGVSLRIAVSIPVRCNLNSKRGRSKSCPDVVSIPVRCNLNKEFGILLYDCILVSIPARYNLNSLAIGTAFIS